MSITNKIRKVFGYTKLVSPHDKYTYLEKRRVDELLRLGNLNDLATNIIIKMVKENSSAFPLEKWDFGRDFDPHCTRSFVDIGLEESQRLFDLSIQSEYDSRQSLADLTLLYNDLVYSLPNDKQQKDLDRRTELEVKASIAEKTTEVSKTIMQGLDAEKNILDKEIELFKKRKDQRKAEKELAEFENDNFKTFNEASINDSASSDIAKDRKHASKTISEAKKAKDKLAEEIKTKAETETPHLPSNEEE